MQVDNILLALQNVLGDGFVKSNTVDVTTRKSEGHI